MLLSFAAGKDRSPRVYVEPFGSKAGGSKIRNELVRLLEKERGIEIVGSRAAADFVIGGAGETFLKGYVGTNPRVRYVNSDALAIYGGFLSVEVKTSQHDIVWSYLATPRRLGPEDIVRNLAGQVVHKIAEAVLEQRKGAGH